eukprot:COSAG02_NODE_3590_length_6517_cov_2.757401_2_plen_415_part_00
MRQLELGVSDQLKLWRPKRRDADILARLRANEDEQDAADTYSFAPEYLSRLRQQHAELTRLQALRPPTPLADFPTGILSHILFTATTHDDLLRHVACCARVCSEWRHTVLTSPVGSAAYAAKALALGRVSAPSADNDTVYQRQKQTALCVDTSGRWATRALTRSQQEHFESNLRRFAPYPTSASLARGFALSAISKGLRNSKHYGSCLHLDNLLSDRHTALADHGCIGHALAAAVQVLPVPLVALYVCQLTAESLEPIVAGMTRHTLGSLESVGMRWLGDVGITMLAKALPLTVQRLEVSENAFGDAGMKELVGKLCRLTNLRVLELPISNNVSGVGWVNLAEVLPRLSNLTCLNLSHSESIGTSVEATISLATAIGRCPKLHTLDLYGCEISVEAKAALHRAWAPRRRGLHLQ